ncbi:protein FAM184A isoform X2 [Drosophila eugracilis]|uniref:protein FAM184A isoform X2 n=1 Tax=Drosophila eugracilis TaxID=29029 RepID=UPI0007E6E1CF|nr:protein FAM184A isoform X2 [Drosophila eugracilis]XP_017068839.1 protein FAM184A isoform X2 [Drosophila eugracilis]
MSTPYRVNKASRLRGEAKNAKPIQNTSNWTPATKSGGIFDPPPIIDASCRSRSRMAASRIPIYRLSTNRSAVSLASPTRKTSPVRSTSLNRPPSASSCSLPNPQASEQDPKTEIDKVSSKQNVAIKGIKTVAGKPLAQTSGGARKAERSHQQVLEQNQIKAFEALKNKLECMQSEFMHKLRSVGPQYHKKTVYKFVAVVVNDECKVLVHTDDMLRLPKNFPLESINDLKNRCRNIVDLGFMLFYEYLPFIQKAKNEFELRDKQEEIRNKLSALVNKKMNSVVEEIDQLCGPSGSRIEAANNTLYREMADLRLQKQQVEGRYFEVKKEHVEQMNRLRAEYELKLSSELEKRDQTISELRKNLQRSEELVNEHTIRLAEKNATLINEDGTIDELRNEVTKLKSANKRMMKQLEEADVGLEKARSSVDKHVKQVTYLDGELKEAREFIVNLQKRPDVMDKGIKEKDLIIADLKLQLQNIEQHKDVLNKQVANALKQHADFEDINGKYKSAVMQIRELKDALKISATKSEKHFKAEEQLRQEIAKMREQMDLDKQMLTARSELIKSLQKNEQENRAKLDQMYYQINAKETQINQVNNELASKNEEFANLFGTLTFKQTELRRQEHVIQLLKEQNSRVSLLRADQDERNAAMQDEIKTLKNTLYSVLLGQYPAEGNEVASIN